MHSECPRGVTNPVSPRCLQLLAMTALLEPQQLVAIAYALKNDAQLRTIQLARSWWDLPLERRTEIAQGILVRDGG